MYKSRMASKTSPKKEKNLSFFVNGGTVITATGLRNLTNTVLWELVYVDVKNSRFPLICQRLHEDLMFSTWFPDVVFG